MEGPSFCGLYVESVQNRGDWANLGLDVVDAVGLFAGPECCHQPPVFIEFVVLRALPHSACSAQVYLQEGSSNSSSKYCILRARHAVSRSRQT
jgi:hypothetical protein